MNHDETNRMVYFLLSYSLSFMMKFGFFLIEKNEIFYVNVRIRKKVREAAELETCSNSMKFDSHSVVTLLLIN